MSGIQTIRKLPVIEGSVTKTPNPKHETENINISQCKQRTGSFKKIIFTSSCGKYESFPESKLLQEYIFYKSSIFGNHPVFILWWLTYQRNEKQVTYLINKSKILMKCWERFFFFPQYQREHRESKQKDFFDTLVGISCCSSTERRETCTCKTSACQVVIPHSTCNLHFKKLRCICSNYPSLYPMKLQKDSCTQTLPSRSDRRITQSQKWLGILPTKLSTGLSLGLQRTIC